MVDQSVRSEVPAAKRPPSARKLKHITGASPQLPVQYAVHFWWLEYRIHTLTFPSHVPTAKYSGVRNTSSMLLKPEEQKPLLLEIVLVLLFELQIVIEEDLSI